MSITYPFTINNEEELISHITQHIQIYTRIHHSLTQHSIQDKLKKLTVRNEEVDQVIKLQELSLGTHSNNKGKLFESNIQQIVLDVIKDDVNWQIDENKNITKCMDVRLTYNNEHMIGIECKDKKTITQKDITKFYKDKSTNKFIGNIFISTHPIPNILESGIKILKNELFIVSHTNHEIYNYISFYLKQIEHTINHNQDSQKIEQYHDINRINYLDFQNQKKMLRDADKRHINNIKELVDYNSLIKGHLYFTTISNCKKTPY
jgi:hypothetical protein